MLSADLLKLPELLHERQAAERLGMSADTLRRIRSRGEIAYFKIGGRPKYTEKHILDYLTRNEVPACPKSQTNDNSNSGRTGSANAQIAPNGAEHGSMPTRDRLAEHRSALMILKPQSSRSPNG
jgi:hypothetical protein